VPSIAFPLGVFPPHRDVTALAQGRAQRTPQRGNFGVSEKPNLYGRAQKDRRALTAQRPTCADSAGAARALLRYGKQSLVVQSLDRYGNQTLVSQKSDSTAPKCSALSGLRAAPPARAAPVAGFVQHPQCAACSALSGLRAAPPARAALVAGFL
jgi:hypothetical protein